MSACPFARASPLGQAFVRPGGHNSIKPAVERWVAPPLSGPSTLDAAGYRDLIGAIKDACEGGELSPPTLCRLGFHSVHIAAAAARDANGGWHQFEADYGHPSNGGLGDDIAFLLQLQKTRFPGITHADLFSLVGSLGPELAGGPPIAWYPGRLDSTGPGPTNPAFSSALPDGMLNAAGVQSAFESILGLTIREQVIFLGGGHSFGGATLDGSGWSGAWTGGDSWPTPPNKFFIDLLGEEWALVTNESSGKPQYVLAAEASAPPRDDSIFRLPADFALRTADAFARWSAVYAKDEAAFTRDFQRVYQRAMQVGAGGAFKLMPDVFHWRGFAGAFEGFGTAIAPLDDDVDGA